MSDITDAAALLKKAAEDAEATTDFFDAVTTGGVTEQVTNPNNGITVPTVRKQVKDLYDADDAVQAAQAAQAASEFAASESQQSATDAAASAVEADAAASAAAADAEVSAVEAASGGKNTILYDDQGNPNVMVWINKFNCEDVAAAILEKHGVDLNIGAGVHPAFIKDGVELRGFWYGKYQASPASNSGCSVIAGVQPYTGINYDQSKSKCTAKGAGWHMSTMHEWAAVSLLSAAYGAPVRGNTNYGRAHDATYETCRRADSLAPGDSAGTGRADCGTGPATWSHDGTMFGVFDMTGNVWEWQDLFKLTDGNIITTPDNNPDLDEASWTATTAFFDGDSGVGHLNDSRTSTGATSTSNGADIIQDATYTKIELLRRLTVEVDASFFKGRFYINNDGERLPVHGGFWNNGSSAGLAALSLNNTRTDAYYNFGFRPAFFESY